MQETLLGSNMGTELIVQMLHNFIVITDLLYFKV